MLTSRRIAVWAMKRPAVIIILCAFALGVLFLLDVGKSVQIHTVRGELRFRFIGVPYDYSHQWEEDERLLEEIALGPPEIVGEWRRCGSIERAGNFAYLNYTLIAALARVDPRAARFCLEDEVSWIIRTQCEKGVPLAAVLSYGRVGPDDQGRWALSPEWWRNDMLRSDFEEAGYEFSESQDSNRSPEAAPDTLCH